MPFSQVSQQELLRRLGVNPFFPGASGATPPYAPPAIGGNPLPPGAGDPGVDPSGTMGSMPAKQGLLSRLLGAAFPVSNDGGAVTPEQQQAAQRQGLLGFGASLLANSGPQPGPGIGFGAAVGQALQAGQGAASGSINDQLQRELLRARIADVRQGPSGGQDPALVAEYKFAQQNGFTGTFQDYIKSKQSPVQQPSAIQEAQYFASLTPDQQRQYLEVKRAAPTPFVPAQQGGADVAFDRRSGQSVVTATPEQNQAAAAALKAAETGGSATGKARGEFQAGYQDALNLVDDEIARTDRLLGEFERDRYQTGPILGPGAAKFTTAGQDLSRESGKDVLKGINSATFGQFTQKELELVRSLGINPSANEESNINLLKQRQTELQKAKQRLLTKGNQQGAAGSFTPPGVPASAAVSAGAPVQVTSAAEARKLPKGTQFVTPDGRTMVVR